MSETTLPPAFRTDPVFEDEMIAALVAGGYVVERDVRFETPIGPATFLAHRTHDKDGKPIYVSLARQVSFGSTEQKIPLKAMRLISQCLAWCQEASPNPGSYHPDCGARSYLVLAGDGWSLLEWYLGSLQDYLRDGELCEIVTADDFAARAREGSL